jgi:hypothetical protein
MTAQSDDKDIVGPIILWVDYGYEGWKPTSFQSIEDALKSEYYGNWIITRRVDWKVTE